jgi:biopolymer transport protein TolR
MDTGGGGKGKKSLDVSINLTPFIDLMAVTISFLIMTAVWTQIGRFQVAQAGGPASDDQQQQEEQTKTVLLTLFITTEEMRLVADQSEFPPIDLKRGDGGKLDLAALLARFKEIKGQFPEQTAITLQTEDKVRYEDLVRIVDHCIGAGLPQISISAIVG